MARDARTGLFSVLLSQDRPVHTLPSAWPRSRWCDRLELQKRLEAEAAATRDPTRAPPRRKTTGSYVGLCMPIAFPDLPNPVGQQEVNDFCNKRGYTGFGNNGSVFDYFHDMSLGKLHYSTLVTPLYTAQRPRSHYTDPKRPFGERAQALIREALSFHRAKQVDFSSLTTDPQRCIYAVNVLYAGDPGEWGKGLWPHASRLDTPFELASRRIVLDYQISAVADGLELGVYCHENGHMLCDFPDLYAYSDQTRNVGVGRYCLMCLGCNADGANPTHVSAYLKYRAGWGEAIPLTTGEHVLRASEPNRFYIHQRSSSEYFILELRRNGGRDAALSGSGLAVWHIDEPASNAEPATAEAGHRHAECRMLQADGLRELETLQDDGDANDLFGPGTSAVFGDKTIHSGEWWDGTPSGLQISDLKQSGADLRFSASVS